MIVLLVPADRIEEIGPVRPNAVVIRLTVHDVVRKRIAAHRLE